MVGDIFQLLDRTEEGKSQYKITNVNLQDYLNKVFKDKNIHFDYIVIPSNLYIVATMNTSDQNVFTLDTAFKRRWKFEKLPNVFAKDHEYAEYYVPGMTGVTWRHLVDSINRYIVKNADELSSEDKQLGVYFIGKETLCKEQTGETDVVKKKEFAYKLLEYLWDDVAKYMCIKWTCRKKDVYGVKECASHLPLFCIEKDTRVGVLYAPFACVLMVYPSGLEPETTPSEGVILSN